LEALKSCCESSSLLRTFGIMVLVESASSIGNKRESRLTLGSLVTLGILKVAIVDMERGELSEVAAYWRVTRDVL